MRTGLLVTTLLSTAVMLGCESPNRNRLLREKPTKPAEIAKSSTAKQNSTVRDRDSTDAPSEIRYLRVNGEILTVEEVMKALRPRLSEISRQANDAEFRQRAIELAQAEIGQRVRELLLYQKASQYVDDEIAKVVDRYVDEIIVDRVNTEYGGRQSRYEQSLATEGHTLKEVKETFHRQLIIDRYLQEQVFNMVADPTRAELYDFYREHIEDYRQPGRRELFLIEVKKTSSDARQKIDEAKKDLNDGADFETVAKRYSEDMHASEGGAWGMIREPLQGRYQRPGATAWQLDSNQMSPVVETDDAFFIVRVGTIIPDEVAGFEAVQPTLMERYRNFQHEVLLNRSIQSLLEKAEIEPREDMFFSAVMKAVSQNGR